MDGLSHFSPFMLELEVCLGRLLLREKRRRKPEWWSVFRLDKRQLVRVDDTN